MTSRHFFIPYFLSHVRTSESRCGLLFSSGSQFTKVCTTKTIDWFFMISVTAVIWYMIICDSITEFNSVFKNVFFMNFYDFFFYFFSIGKKKEIDRKRFSKKFSKFSKFLQIFTDFYRFFINEYILHEIQEFRSKIHR